MGFVSVVVSACGGDGEGVDTIGGIQLPPGPAEYRTLVQDGLNLALASSATTVSERPPGTNVVTYTGVINISTPEASVTSSMPGEAYFGSTTANVDLSANTIAGTASGFFKGSYSRSATDTLVLGQGTAVTSTDVEYNGINATDVFLNPVTFSGALDGKTLAGDGHVDFEGTDGEFIDIFGDTVTLDGNAVEMGGTAQR